MNPTGSQHKFLVVDDQRSVREFVKAMLAVFDPEVFEAGSGEQALELIGKHEFEIIFLDVNMTGINGLEVCRRVRNEMGFQRVPIIILTAIESAELLEEAFAAGATDYVKKAMLRFELLPRARAIIERRNAERAMYQAKREAEGANKAKSDFIASMSHELRTPLNAILGFTDLLQSDAESPLPEYQREYVGHIHQAGWHLLHLINDILDLAKIESGKVAIELAGVDVAELVNECLKLNEANAAKFGVRLVDKIGAGPWFVTADPVRLKQVLLNFISNAIKYNRRDGMASVAVEQRPDRRLRIVIADTGNGIPPDKLDQLFQPFSRLGAEKSNIEGHGIGLALTKRLVELMGGTVGVESTVGEGSRFWVEFPQVIADQATADKARVTQHADDVEQRLMALRDKRILYVEDNAINRILITKILSKYPGIELRCAETGEEGLEVIEAFAPHLLLLDMQLPGISGKEVLQVVRPKLDIPVLAFSADAMPETVREILEAGALDYITKPLDVPRFKRLLLEQIG